MYRSVAESATRGGMASDNGDVVVTLDQLPRWSDADLKYYVAGDLSSPLSYFSDPLTSPSEADSGGKSRFPVDHEINSKIYLWRGNPWLLEVDAVVNSTNESLDEAHISLGLHAAAGPGLAEECASLIICRVVVELEWLKLLMLMISLLEKLFIQLAPSMLSSTIQPQKMLLAIAIVLA